MTSSNSDINLALMDAVSAFDVEAVKDCLNRGADPNYTAFKDEDEPSGLIQPTTPLRMVMFRISDCMLNDNDILVFAEIAKILLHFGADPKPAMLIAEDRYGAYKSGNANEGAFMKVWSIVAKGI